MPLVVDASIALSWALPDESSVYAERVLAVAERDGVRVPELWAREVANGLAFAYRRKRLTSDDERVFLAALSRLNIRVEHAPSAATAIRDGTAAAMRSGLTAYDAAYVDLASREGLVLATLDAAMRKAAQESQVTIFTPD
jgi:predicted nucleic acid-binding protein